MTTFVPYEKTKHYGAGVIIGMAKSAWAEKVFEPRLGFVLSEGTMIFPGSTSNYGSLANQFNINDINDAETPQFAFEVRFRKAYIDHLHKILG